MKTRFVIIFGLLLASVMMSSAQTYSIDWFTVDGGGGTSTGGVFSVSGTIGQPDANHLPMTGGGFSLIGGFWSLVSVQTAGAPILQIVPTGVGLATILWTPATPGWILQESLSLAPATWGNSPSGATNPIVVSATLPTKFYRLFRP